MNSAEVPNWAAVFEQWLRESVLAWNTRDLFDYWRMAPHGVQAHPSEEHILPLFVPMGAGDALRQPAIAHEGFMHGSLSMLSLAFQ
jgi:4,5-DOPA dioxygenase extradiol